MWWKGMPYVRARPSKSRWLETIAGISMLSAPVRPAEQQIVEAVTEPGHHDQGAGRCRGLAQRPGDAVRLGDGTESVTQCFQLRVRVGNVEVNPHEETALQPIVELLAFQDVARVPDEEAAHCVDQSGAVGTGEGEDVLTTGLRTRVLSGHSDLRRCVLHNMVSDTQHGRLGAAFGQGRPHKYPHGEIVIRQPLDAGLWRSSRCSTTSN